MAQNYILNLVRNAIHKICLWVIHIDDFHSEINVAFKNVSELLNLVRNAIQKLWVILNGDM